MKKYLDYKRVNVFTSLLLFVYSFLGLFFSVPNTTQCLKKKKRKTQSLKFYRKITVSIGTSVWSKKKKQSLHIAMSKQ